MTKDFIEMSETGNWNVADPYTKIKIMQPLYFIDEYERIAIFGTSNLLEEFIIAPEMMKHARVRALKRLNHELILICDNTKFALKKPNDKETMEYYKQILKRLWTIQAKVSENKRNSVDKTKDNQLNINEDLFDKVLNTLSEIKGNINILLNNSDLIFTSTDEFDPKKLKQKIIDDILESG